MITSLRGVLVEAFPPQITVEVRGVGYELLLPLSSFDRLPGVGQEIHILTHLAVREDAHTLYGFMTASERELFRLLIHTVSGIGPKLALNILSGMDAAAFRSAVATADVRGLSQISGVGKKTAERIVVELRDKLGAQPAAAGTVPARPSAPGEKAITDTMLALVTLGHKQAEALESARAAQVMLGPQATVEELLRAALKKPRG